MQLTTNFHSNEFACKSGGAVPASCRDNIKELARNLQVLRDAVSEPVYINSAYRTKAYNTKVGGSPKSQHLKAKAADIRCKGKTPKELAEIIEGLIAKGDMKQGGVGIYKGFVHYDTRGIKARWTL